MINVNSKIELLPCPFCGGRPRKRTGSDFTKSNYSVFCETCHASTPIAAIEAEATVAWNRRTSTGGPSIAQRLVDAGLIGGAVLSGVAAPNRTGGAGAEPDYRLDKQMDYAVHLQRIIESICKGRPLRDDARDGAPHHYAMASAYIAATTVVRDDCVFTVYDWAYSDPTGQEHYARTPERATALAAQGVKLTPVYTRESRAAAIKSVSSRSEANHD